MLPSTDLIQKMRQLCPLLLLLALAGCASSGDWFHRDEPKPEPPTSQVIPQDVPSQAAPQAAPNRSNLSPAATAAAPPADANESAGELMDCVTESCKINCSPKVAARFRPKWCARFKEPL
jgi:hypothetical protein